MCATPVRNCHTLEAPLSAEDLVVQVCVLRAVEAVYLVVGRHNAHCASLLYGSLERLEVDLAHCSLVSDHVNASAVGFLVVECVVLEADSCTGVL